jgi:hypothetical protein
MSRKFLTNIDLNNNLLINPVLNNTHGSANTAGSLYYSGGKLVFGTGSATATVATMADTVTVGSTAITIGGSATTIAGLSSVTSTTFVGALTGNASTATTLQTSRNINGVAFNGSADITVTAAAGTLSGNTLNSGVTASSLTSVGTLTGLTMGGNIAMANNKITGLGTPTADTDAATKLYVDQIAAGLHVHPSVNYATTGALGTAGNLVGGTITTTYSNGTSGVGATLTIATSSNWTNIQVDGQTVTANDRILIKNQGGTTSNLQNGIYTVTSVGAVGNTTSFVFTRALDADQSPEIDAGDLTYVVAGTVNGGDGYVQVINGVTVGTTAIEWSQFSGSGAVPIATTTSVGIASFPAAQFSVSGAGAVAIDNLSGGLITSGTVADGRIASALTGKTYNGLTVTSSTGTLSVANGKTLTASNTLTFSGTDSSTLNIGTGGTLGTAAYTATTAYLAAGVTSLPSVTSVNSTTIPNSATLLVSGGALGTPSSATLTNATGLPVSTGIQGLGTNVATALAVAVGSSGAFVTNGGALGTPSSGTLTNATGLPVAGISNLGANVGTFLITPTSENLRAALSDESGSGALVFAGGNIGAATATTATAGNSSTLVATTAFVATAVAASGVKKYSALNSSITPSGSPGEAQWVISSAAHGLGAIPSLTVQMFQVSDGAQVEVDVFVAQATSIGQVTLKWNASTTVAADTYRVVIMG